MYYFILSHYVCLLRFLRSWVKVVKMNSPISRTWAKFAGHQIQDSIAAHRVAEPDLNHASHCLPHVLHSVWALVPTPALNSIVGVAIKRRPNDNSLTGWTRPIEKSAFVNRFYQVLGPKRQENDSLCVDWSVLFYRLRLLVWYWFNHNII